MSLREFPVGAGIFDNPWLYVAGSLLNFYLSLYSLGASIERYNNEAWHEDSFKIFSRFPSIQ